jgi:hypothetical protein
MVYAYSVASNVLRYTDFYYFAFFYSENTSSFPVPGKACSRLIQYLTHFCSDYASMIFLTYIDFIRILSSNAPNSIDGAKSFRIKNVEINSKKR